MHCCSTDGQAPVLGITLVALGVLLALGQFGLFDLGTLLSLWPVALILIGARMMATALRPRRSGLAPHTRNRGIPPR